MTQLSPNFSLEEMLCSQEGVRKGIDNTPSSEIVENLRSMCEQSEAVRTLLAAPMLISSGYRCEALNTLIGGAKDSAHLSGWAMDFISPGFGNPLEICRTIAASGIAFDKCIQEGSWTHISFAPAMRRQLLTAKFSAGEPTQYTQGV